MDDTTVDEVYAQLYRMKTKMATRNDIDELKEEDLISEKKILRRTDELEYLQSTIETLKNTHLDQEQLKRKNCLRLYNVDLKNNNENYLEKLQNILKNVKVEIPQQYIDGVHKGSQESNGNKPPPLIVKLNTLKHRRKLYKARKHIREKLGYSLQVDLSKEKLDLLRQVRVLGETQVPGFEYAYAGMNCGLYMKLNGKFVSFKTLDEAKLLLGLINEDDGDMISTKKKFSKVAKRFSRGQGGSNRGQLTHASNSSFTLLNEEDDDIDFDDIRGVHDEDIGAISEESDEDKLNRPSTMTRQTQGGTGRQLPQINDPQNRLSSTNNHASGEAGRQLPQPPGDGHLGNTEPIVFYDEDNEFEYKKE